VNTPQIFHELALSRNHFSDYQLQMGLGSTILRRLQSPMTGQMRQGAAINYQLETELRRDRAYDVLVLAENHAVLSNIMYNNTVSMSRRFYDLFTAGNPDGQAYLYENWWTTNDPDLGSLLNRISRERLAWNCVASAVNTTRGARKPMKVLPASTALRALILEIQAGQVPGVAAPSELFTDNVHLTHLGNYFIALLDYAVIYERDPRGLPRAGFDVRQNAPFPSQISEATAQKLQEIAWNQAQLARSDQTSHLQSLEACATQLQNLCVSQAMGWACNPNNRCALAASFQRLAEPLQPGTCQ